MVFNEVTYPNLIKLFKKLGVDFYDTSMSFSFCDKDDSLEYNGKGFWNGLFSDHKNIFNPKFYKLLYNINRFNKIATQYAQTNQYTEMTILEFFLNSEKFKQSV
jgi:predicted NAD/FAD-binding protein